MTLPSYTALRSFTGRNHAGKARSVLASSIREAEKRLRHVMRIPDTEPFEIFDSGTGKNYEAKAKTKELLSDIYLFDDEAAEELTGARRGLPVWHGRSFVLRTSF